MDNDITAGFLHLAEAVNLQAYPNVEDSACEDALAAIALSTSSTSPNTASNRRLSGTLEGGSANKDVLVEVPLFYRALRLFVRDVKREENGLSVLQWYREHHELIGAMRPDFWLMKVQTECLAAGSKKGWRIERRGTCHAIFDGNFHVEDFIAFPAKAR